MEEVWRPAKSYEDSHSVNNVGVVKSISRQIIYKSTLGKPVQLPIRGRILHGCVGKRGYRVVSMKSNNGKCKTLCVHRLVAEAFIPNPENKTCVNHKNGVKTDNRVENLEWCSYKENVVHAFRTGLQRGVAWGSDKQRVFNATRRKLTFEEAEQIRQLHLNGFGYKKLSKLHGVDPKTIQKIVKNKSYTEAFIQFTITNHAQSDTSTGGTKS